MFAYMSSETTFYCGCPIKCEGITVASLCCCGIQEPKGWCEKDVLAVEAIAARVGAALEKEAQANKFQNAQQAMMQQMMMMQMQGAAAMQQQQQVGMGMMSMGVGMMPMPPMMQQSMQMMAQGMPAAT